MPHLGVAPWAQDTGSLNPMLVVVISIDQFSGDLFAKWRGQSTGGLSFLAKQGVVYPNGHARTSGWDIASGD